MNKYDYGVYAIQMVQALALVVIFVAIVVALFLLGRGELLDAIDDVKFWFSQRKLRKQIEKQFATYAHCDMVSYATWDAEMTLSLYNTQQNHKNDEFFDKVEEYRNDFTG